MHDMPATGGPHGCRITGYEYEYEYEGAQVRRREQRAFMAACVRGWAFAVPIP